MAEAKNYSTEPYQCSSGTGWGYRTKQHLQHNPDKHVILLHVSIVELWVWIHQTFFLHLIQGCAGQHPPCSPVSHLWLVQGQVSIQLSVLQHRRLVLPHGLLRSVSPFHHMWALTHPCSMHRPGLHSWTTGGAVSSQPCDRESVV